MVKTANHPGNPKILNTVISSSLKKPFKKHLIEDIEENVYIFNCLISILVVSFKVA